MGDTVTVVVKVVDKMVTNQHVLLECAITNQRGEPVISGRAEVIAPIEKVSRPRVVLPELGPIEKGRRYQHLIAITRGLQPLLTPVVHPVDAVSLVGAIEAARLGLIIPVLVGPEAKIRLVAQH